MKNMNDTRVCKECGIIRPLSDYHLSHGKPRRVCKYCVSAKFKHRYNTDSDFKNRILTNAKQYHENNKEARCEQMRNRHVERYSTDEQYRKSWNIRRRQRYKLDEAYRLKMLSLNHNRRATLNASGIISESDWLSILKYYNNACAYCGSTKALEQDHIIPLSKGGRNTPDNLVPACASCNRSKGARDLLDWYSESVHFSVERFNKIIGRSGVMNINITQPDFNKICPACLGSGKIKAMQACMTYDAGTVRGPDTKTKCPYCNGTGRRDK